MRRSAVLGLVTAVTAGATLALGIAPAAAHICPVPDQIPVGQPATISVGVTVEGAVVPDVTITIPSGLRLNRIDAKADWTTTRSGSTVHYRGGPIAAYTCEYFSLGVSAAARGSFGIDVVQRTAAGEVVARSTPNPDIAEDRQLGQIVYAGVKPPSISSGSSGLPTTTIAGIALVAFGIVMAGVLAFRARRGGSDDEDDRDAELRERLEQFKQQAPGRRPRR